MGSPSCSNNEAENAEPPKGSSSSDETVTYTWLLSTIDNKSGENYYYDSTSGTSACLTFFGNGSTNGSNYVQLGGKSCDEGKIPTDRYFKFTATRSGIVSVVHSVNGSTANTSRWTVITADGVEIASAKAEGEPASSNKATLSGTVTVTDQPVEVWIYCVKGDARYYSIEYKEL